MCGNCEIVPPETQVEKLANLKRQLASYDPKFMDVTHTFTSGVYTRTGKALAGEIIIGAEHRLRSIFHLAKGRVAVWDKFNGVRVLMAPHSEITFPGTQRIGVVLEDIEGCNILETDWTTVEQVEAEMLVPFTLPAFAAENILILIDAPK